MHKIAINESKVLNTLVVELLSSIDTPVALATWMLFRNKEYDQIVSRSVSAFDYTDAQAFELDYQAVEFLKKYPKFKLSVNPKEQAMANFTLAEARCRNTNYIIDRNLLRENGYDGALISRLRNRVEDILGTMNRTTLEHCLLAGRFGPGVTSSAKGNALTTITKYTAERQCTPTLVPYLPQLTSVVPEWGEVTLASDGPCSSLEPGIELLGNKVAFVPKNAKTHRAIAVEPHANAFFQRGVGVIMSKRLRRYGIDLSNQQINSRLAREGSITNELATIDLRMASDTVSNSVVRELLGTWAPLLMALRSPNYMCPTTKRWKPYAKHSSMGNGYTFELETTIFTAVCYIAAEDCGVDLIPQVNFHVYGDDIIVPVTCARRVISLLNAVGFGVNEDKTFIDGPFRESCGEDYYLGHNVRPIYCREALDGLPSLYRMANAILCLSFRSCGTVARDRRWFNAWRSIYQACPSRYRFRIPLTGDEVNGYVTDGGFIGSFDESASAITWSMSGGFSIKALVFVPKRYSLPAACRRVIIVSQTSQSKHMVICNHPVPELRDSALYDGETYRKRGLWRVLRQSFCDWPHLGPWI